MTDLPPDADGILNTTERVVKVRLDPEDARNVVYHLEVEGRVKVFIKTYIEGMSFNIPVAYLVAVDMLCEVVGFNEDCLPGYDERISAVSFTRLGDCLFIN